ncbi:phage tail protein [Pseudomonas sp. FJ2-5-13]|uniref:TipJ family phage tail tip protein n=1 Tax=Pseudomonas sp. FJ2-5-13 TaxID=2976884 RepID=UPI0023D7FA6A|nr:phage tail protein [Pseudomonas sp. FJ2-5-13]WEJ03489.1 phage tail protein [Pseudomonas sp. FJ2-5-13]
MGDDSKIDIHGAKGGEEKTKTPTEAPDSLRSVAVAKMLIAVGEGEFEGTPTARDIYLDNTPLQDPQGNMNFPNVKWEWRTGAVDQTYIQGIPSVENETTISTELRSGTPWVRAINNTQLSAVRVRFAWPALQSVDTGGNINGYRIEYKVELATDGGAYQQVLSEAVDGKTTSVYERTRRIDLPKATTGWLMRITRITVNQNNNKISDNMQIAGFTEVIDAKIRYPNTALLYIEFSAEQFRSIPAVTVETKLKKMQVPSNYDPVSRSYSGVWDGTFKQAWTDNPVWMTYDITTADRFGLGRRIKPWMVDKWELYRISQYCDQLVPDGKGGQEPRFICNLNLQSKADAWSLLRDISAIYRGMTYWAQGQVFTLSDMPRATDFDFAYTRANVIDGKFTYSSASERTRYTRALVSYDNPLNNYDTDVTAVTDQKLQRRYGDNPLEISAIGCTRESEAQRRGKWALLTNSKDRAVTFKVGLDGRIPLPGYVIPIADELLAGRAIGGRISAVNGKVITLDRDTQAKLGDRLILNLPDGKCEGRTVQLVSGRQVTVTVAYSVVPEPELVWALDADDLAVPLYRVVSVARPEPGVFEISAVQYDPSKFAHIDTGARLEERPISVIPITVVPPPASVTLTSSYAVNQGIAISTMNISWPAVAGAVAYDVEWRKDSGNWIKVQRTGSTSVDVTGIYSGAYLARVRAVSAFEISSIWKNSSLTNLEGKTGLPPAVSFLTTTSLIYGIGIQWGFPPGSEDTQRTEIWYNQSADLTTAVKLSDFSYPQASHEMHSLLAGASLFFWARLVDRTGNVGPFFPVPGAVNGQASSKQSDYEAYYAEKIGKGALYQSLREEIELITGDGPGSVNERLEEAKQELEDLIKQVSDALAYDPEKPYLKGDIVRLDQRLYQAKGPVPVGATPPDATYWIDIGTILETTDALVSQVQIIETKIEEIDGKVLATATSVEALRSAARGDDGAGDLADAIKGWTSTADLAVERKTRASENDAMAQQLLTLGAQVGDNKSSLTVLEQVVASNRETSAAQINQLKSDLSAVDQKATGNAQALTSLDTKVTNLDGKITSQSSSNEALRASVRGDDGSGDLAGAIKAWESTAAISTEKKVRASEIEAQAKVSETLQSSIGETSASVRSVSETVVGLDNKVSAQVTLQAQTIVGGKRVTTGLAFGSNGSQSEFLIMAQRMAVVNEIDGKVDPMFVIENGQAIFNTAIISKAFIEQIVLGMSLRSAAVDAYGNPLIELNMATGAFALRGAKDGNTSVLNSSGIKFTYANGVDGIDLSL